MAENGLGSDAGSQDNLAAEAISLDIEELDDAEYAIPAVEELPSLESILTEPDCGSLSGTDDDIGAASLDKLGGSETASVGSLLSLTSLSKGLRPHQAPLPSTILRHVILKGISSQIVSASEKVNAGLASAVAASGNMIVVGTSHGLVLGFDSLQTLRWCDQEARQQGSVSALEFNHDGTRLLAGFARGHILMIESANGKVLRTLTDVHPPGTAVLHLKFTDSPKLALCSDSGGSVFELNFTRVMGVRGCDSKCLFSGSRGEVCALEPLLLNQLQTHPLKNYVLVAMATLSKVIVVCIRPGMRVVLTHMSQGLSITPPQVSWQLVLIQSADASRVVDPVLAIARDDTVHFYQVCTENRVRLNPLRKMTVSYTISNLRWLNSRSLVALDIQEKLHLIDVRTQENLETIDMSRVGIAYASSHFKGLTTGGNVSKAMALAGEHACYNTVVTYGSQLLLLGMKSLHIVCIRTWTERLKHLTLQRRYPEALALGLTFYQDKGRAVVGLRGSKQRRKQIARDKVCQVLVQYMDELTQCNSDEIAETEIVSTCVDYCIKLENTELLFEKFWDLVAEYEGLKSSYLQALESPLLDGSLPPRLPPLIAQQMVALYDSEEKLEALQAIIVLLSVDCLDIHQVTTICRQRALWEALIHLQTSALGDYSAPIHQLVPVLQTFLTDEDKSLSRDCIRLGNALLVYASCCLAGRGFPRGELPEGLPQRVKADVLSALLSLHSNLASDAERQYPYLRTLLKFDARGFLDVIAIAFREPEFTSEMGLRQRQRLINILLDIVVPTTPLNPRNPEYLSNEQRAVVLILVVNEVAAGTVNLEVTTVNKIVELLCSDSSDSISKDHKAERENAILELLQAKKLFGISDNSLLNLAQRAKFLRIAELLYTAREDWVSVCDCLIQDPMRNHEIWPWLEKLSHSSLEEVVQAHICSLLEIDSLKFATVVATRLPTKLIKLLSLLDGRAEVEYYFLRALYQLLQMKDEDNKLELTTELYERYLVLMYKYQPKRVVHHISGYHGCRLDEALRIVQEANDTDAEAIMLEKLGNYQAAFDLKMNVLKDLLQQYFNNEITDESVVETVSQLSGLCRRAAGNIDWMCLVEVVLRPNSENSTLSVEELRSKLLKIVLQSLSGTNALSTVLEKILKHPLAVSGTIGDIRQLLSGVLTHSRYEQTLVETTARLVSLELHEALKKSLRESQRACSISLLICLMCRGPLSQCTDYIVAFGCGHGYHMECLPEPKCCYKCHSDNGWAPMVQNYSPPSPRPPEQRKITPPAFMQERDLSLKLAPPTLM